MAPVFAYWSLDEYAWPGDQVRHPAVFEGRLFAAGEIPAPAGSRDRLTLAVWEENHWQPLPGTSPGVVQAILPTHQGLLAAFGDHRDHQNVTHFAVWDGTQWNDGPLNLRGQIFDLTIYKGDLYIGGIFSQIGDVPARNLARWDGQAFHPLGQGADDAILALAAFQDQLIAGGRFGKLDRRPMPPVAGWDGSRWEPLGSGLPLFEGASPHFTQAEVRTLVEGDGRLAIG